MNLSGKIFCVALFALGCGCEEPSECNDADPGLCEQARPGADLDLAVDDEGVEAKSGLPACAKVAAFSANRGSDGGSRWVAIDTSGCAAVEDYSVEWRLKGGSVVAGWAYDEGTGCSIVEKWEGSDEVFAEAWTLYVDGTYIVKTEGIPGGYDTALTYVQGADDLWIELLPSLPGCDFAI